MHPTRRSAVLLLVATAILASGRSVDAAGARSFKSGPIQVTADGRDVWLVNPDNDSVAHLDTATERVTEYPLPAALTHAPKGLSVREDGTEVWVACHDSDRVYVLAGRGPARGSVVAELPLPYGSGPYSVALSRDQTRALVTLHRARTVAVIDTATRAIAELGPVFHGGLGIVWLEDGTSAWVTHVFADGEHPFLSRVDFSGPEPKLKSQIRALPAHPQTSGARPAEGGYLTHRGHIAQIPSRSGRLELWLPTQYNNIHNGSWDPESTVQSTIRHLELGGRTLPNCNDNCGAGCTAASPNKIILSASEVHCPNGSNPYDGPGWDASVSGPIDIGFRDDGSVAYLLHELSNDLVVVPTNTPSVRPVASAPLVEIATGDRPIGVAVSPTADRAYVANALSRDVSVIDTAAVPPAELRRLASTPVTGEPLAPTILRGARLFHTSDDPRISINAKVSCASCHINAEHDGRGWSLQNLPTDHGERSVQTLLGLNLTFGPLDPASGFGQLHLSGDRDEVQDFEHTFRGDFMRGTGFILAPQTPCPEVNPPDPACTNASRDPDLDAIATYLLSLEPLRKSPYRNADGSLTEAAVRGLTFFLGDDRQNKPADSGCASCHLPPAGPGEPSVFADLRFHDIGNRRGGEEELNNRPAPWTWYVGTQPLVGVWSTPPWEGTANWPRSSMLELLKENAARAQQPNPHGTPDGLTNRQLRDLAAFVLSIDGTTTAAEMLQTDTTPPRIRRVSPTSLTRVEVWFTESIDPTTAADPANYRILSAGGTDMPVTAAVWDAQNGDRVTLTTQLDPCHDQSYDLIPTGTILDVADSATAGVANALDLNDPGNVRRFVAGSTLTITLGSSGEENLTVRVYDAATVNNGNNRTWGHDSVWIGGPNIGFVRFDWQAAFQAATGVTSSADIVDASFSLTGNWGDVQPLELRRTLQSWGDNLTGNDFDNNPPGMPTWNSHAHPSAWNTPGAAALGGTGAAVGDYDGRWDRSATVDLTLTPQAINEPVVFGGANITDAYRFWFDNPSVDYGHAFEVVGGGNGNELKFHRWEHELQQHGPVLTITYALPPAPAAPGEVSGRGSGAPLWLVKTPTPDLRFSFEDIGPVASSYNVYEGAIGSWYSHAGAGCGTVPTPVAGRTEARHTPAAGDRYFVVTASNACAEGPSDLDHPSALLDCAP